MVAGAAIAAIDVVDSEPQRVAALRERIADFRRDCGALGVALSPSDTAIQPLVVGAAARALDVSARLREAGFAVPAIRPPTVAEGSSRLRISLSAGHSADDVRSLAAALAKALAG
jgi:8-amino-7-oxononanoate synthase